MNLNVCDVDSCNSDGPWASTMVEVATRPHTTFELIDIIMGKKTKKHTGLRSPISKEEDNSRTI